jgi:hypothetical protein
MPNAPGKQADPIGLFPLFAKPSMAKQHLHAIARVRGSLRSANHRPLCVRFRLVCSVDSSSIFAIFPRSSADRFIPNAWAFSPQRARQQLSDSSSVRLCDPSPTILRIPYAGHLKSKSKSYAAAAMKLADKEAIMLDFAFVALGFATIALMGFYAMALRRL